MKTDKERVDEMFFKNRKKKCQEDLNQKVCKYQRWWQDQTEESPPSRSNFKKNKKSPRSDLKREKDQKILDDSFVYFEGN